MKKRKCLIFSGPKAEEVSYSEFLEELVDKNVDRVQVENSEIYFTLKEEKRQILKILLEFGLHMKQEDNTNYALW